MLQMQATLLSDVTSGDSAGALQVAVNVTVNGTDVTSLSQQAIPLLQGQTQTSLNASGVADIEGLILSAAPGSYDLFVALPNYPEVPLFATSLLCCAAVVVLFITLHMTSHSAHSARQP